MLFKNNSTGVRKVEISLNVPPHVGNGEVNSVGKVLNTSAANSSAMVPVAQRFEPFGKGKELSSCRVPVMRGGSDQVMVLRWPG